MSDTAASQPQDPPVVLVVGGSGYVAQFVIQALLSCGVCVHATHRANREVNEFPSAIIWHVVDYKDTEAIAVVLRKVKANVVVNCGAMSALGACEKDPEAAAAANCPRGLVHALAAEAAGVPRLFVHFSTDIVFDGDPSKVYDEDSAPAPVNTYGKLKAEFDAFLAERTEPHCAVLRLTNVLGPRHPYVSTGTKFLQWLDGQLRNNSPTTLFEDEFRNYVWVEDIAAVVVRLVEDFRTKPPPHRLMHCGGPDALSRVDVALALAAAKGYSATYRTEEGQEFPRVVPAKRSSVDLGYASPLCVRITSGRAEAYMGRPFRPIDDCIRENVLRI